MIHLPVALSFDSPELSPGAVALFLAGVAASVLLNWTLPPRARKSFHVLAGIVVLGALLGTKELLFLLAIHFATYCCFHRLPSLSRFALWAAPLATLAITVTGSNSILNLAGLLYLVHWIRIAAYASDMAIGLVPAQASFRDYLLVFVGLPQTPSPLLGAFSVQGFDDIHANFREKLDLGLAKKGIWLLLLSFLYANLWPLIAPYFSGHEISEMLRQHAAGADHSTREVWTVVIGEQVRIFLLFAALTHFRIGMWNLLGYSLAPQFNMPWLSTNFGELWHRYSFHYKNFLFRSAYLPVFLGSKRWLPQSLRSSAAIFVAAGWANLAVHVHYRSLKSGWEGIWDGAIRCWPYYLVLSLLISLSYEWNAKRPGSRKAWTFDAWIPLDFLKSASVLLVFSAIHLFARYTPGVKLGHSWSLFLRLFGF